MPAIGSVVAPSSPRVRPFSTTNGPTPTTVTIDGFEASASTSTKKQAERALSHLGHHPGTVDGTFSRNTRHALEVFQEARGLAVTGSLDAATFDALLDAEAKAHNGVQSAGLVSSGVKTVEQRLRRLGYDVGSVDNVFDTRTAAAVRAFKADQGIDVSPALGQHGREVLKGEVQKLAHAPWRTRIKDTAAHGRADDVVTTAARSGITAGDTGRAVATVQRHLRSAGYDPKSTAGTFDARTEGMVREFQRKSGLRDTGVVDTRTWSKLQQAQTESTSATSPSQRRGERSDAVKRTEQMLKKLGFNPGRVDGLYDTKTQKALDAFRRSYRLSGRGQGVGPTTLQKLRAATKAAVTSSQLVRIMPGLEASRARELLPHLNRAMAEFGITTTARKAAFLAQLGHESVSLRYFEEIASGAAYEGRRDLGNTHPGDGVRYKGRGPIQLTGRANYRSVGHALGLPLEAHPTMAAQKNVGFRTAGYFWRSHGLNALADRGDFDAISRAINGGTNGLQSRRDYFARARAVLGA